MTSDLVHFTLLFPGRRPTNISKCKSAGAQRVGLTEIIVSFPIKYVNIRRTRWRRRPH